MIYSNVVPPPYKNPTIYFENFSIFPQISHFGIVSPQVIPHLKALYEFCYTYFTQCGDHVVALQSKMNKNLKIALERHLVDHFDDIYGK